VGVGGGVGVGVNGGDGVGVGGRVGVGVGVLVIGVRVTHLMETAPLLP
jgi:hypothetical protein